MKRLFNAFQNAGKELYLIGGAVRDLALGADERTLDDLDFATNARPQETLSILRTLNMKTYEMGIEFGTVGLVLSGPRRDGYPKDVQVTTYRRQESYAPGSRHPIVSFGDSLEEDLKRRDFSINSIAMDAHGNYIDPYDGLGDIKRKTLRIVAEPETTLAQDPLRILRVARFIAKLGFQPTPDLEHACFTQAPMILEISRQRWLQELHKLLLGPHAAQALKWMCRGRLLNLLLPELASLVDLHQRSPLGPLHADFWAHTTRRVSHAKPTRVARWSALYADVGRPWTRSFPNHHHDLPGPALAGLSPDAFPQTPQTSHSEVSATFPHHPLMAELLFKGVARRLHFDNDSADPVTFILRHQDAWTPLITSQTPFNDSDIRRVVRDLEGHHDDVLDLALASALARDDQPTAKTITALSKRIQELDQNGQLKPSLPRGLGGYFIRTLSVTPGPGLGAIIAYLNEEIIAGHLDSDLPPDAYGQHLQTHNPDLLKRAQDAAGPSKHGKPSSLA